MAKWLLLIVTLMLLAIPASANGGMALVYGTFQWKSWLLYVAITVLFEAAILGRWARIGFSRALGISIGANAATGLLGAGFSGIFGYMMYSIGAKSYVEPNPLVHALFCLIVGGIVSAIIESIFWAKAAGQPALKASLLVHLVGIPVALLILLFPSRPYVGLEGQASFRRNQVKKAIARKLAESLRSEESKPLYAPKNWNELIRVALPVPTNQQRGYSNEVIQVVSFRPHFARFDTGEAHREPCEFNRALVGKDLKKLDRSDWLVRWTTNGWLEGIIVEDGRDARYLVSLKDWLENRKRLP